MTLQDYLNEIQDFDDATQKELLADFQNGNFLDFSSVIQQGTRSFQDFLNMENGISQPMRLGETVRGMSNVSPLLQLRPANNSTAASALKKTYFIDAQMEQSGNLNVINDVKRQLRTVICILPWIFSLIPTLTAYRILMKN